MSDPVTSNSDENTTGEGRMRTDPDQRTTEPRVLAINNMVALRREPLSFVER